MPLVLFHTERVRQALKGSANLGIELLVLAGAAAMIGAVLMLFKHAVAPFHQAVQINLSVWALPGYAVMSLSRGFAAYGLSLVFTLVYGTIAAHNARAEKVMIPALDVLQAIPVLGFLPGLVLTLVHLFPTRQIGLEAACIIMIFTGQVWNMTFSYHASVRGIPAVMREAAAIQRFSKWQMFKWLELPASMIGLIWNSMMSMAGGWFFLTVNEAFRLGEHDYRLPGIGSYMNEAISGQDHLNVPAMIAGIITMVIMIVVVDQVFWRPIVVWAQRFKMEEQAATELPRSWVLDVLARSFLIGRLRRRLSPRRWPGAMQVSHRHTLAVRAALRKPIPAIHVLRVGSRWLVIAILAVLAVWGAWGLMGLMTALPVRNPAHPGSDWISVGLALAASFGRTSAAVVLGAIWALPVGILIGLSPRWSQRLQPVIQVAASFPAPMLFPLVTLGLAVVHVPFTYGCIALMLLGTQWYILFNVVAGASAIPHDLIEVANANGLSQFKRWTRLYVPCVFPYLLTGLITAAGGAWNATIVAEYLVIRRSTWAAFGLGSTISQATAEGNFPLLAASIITMAVFVVILNRLFWKRLYRLAEARYSLNM